ncbi:MAG TPA: aminoacyl-tRNA hydrolase [Candidatus Vogelbacteria bacterium]|uniref:Peptidyl-tRNA hydrolase n=1 Tax=Candidatus Vogelbacteria bacterium RIFOXYD1_FULL_51_18 TaxID=1802440 RepID=A0A1G2QIK1_9BACT|nr:MAG: Peptidyl-tRNA hydrolase [Parcubacteria group bacterium GW2011_GWC1_51_35]KKW25341.1 MAG: Peptidyl-tRNA hydrolase [Parcubacteria group bacterium GW2011_GWF2_52_12]KKW27309.1 MAG: Peptidyl-tRNA hydrolase [Parcubacteria group bacterium GW2011_GWF1_52_5]KKW35043.1 MAG: Peptidyl-tRNA hydrolase [Parcubacteria group bacterium GW2011_GWB1_53_43]KKW38787.1 MAG: Peptidyl-tRNA hydrolase [Parcubacteria group bacterium GW2011_GWA1_54_88]OHA60203.1 MAG: hypothetical protein A2569_01410 [Candidatus V
MAFIIAGLGNPGEEYSGTRHNTGRIITELIARRFECAEWKENKKLKALRAFGKAEKDRVEFVLPNTFMNKSGAALLPLVKNVKQAERLIVIHDDLDLALGSCKLSFNRGSGGHKGVESIIRALKTKGFVRVRAGISKATPKGKIKKPSGEDAVGEYILGKFKKDELDALKKVAKRVGDALLTLITEGREKAMSLYNK